MDADLVVINKPSGLLVHRGWANDDDVALFRVRDALGAHVHAVHRLDRGTSGALGVRAHAERQRRPSPASFESQQVDKRYLALVRGVPADAGTIDHPIPAGRGSFFWGPARPRGHPLQPGRPLDRRSLLAGAGDSRDRAEPSDKAAPAPPRASADRRRQLRLEARSTATTAPPTIFTGWPFTLPTPSRSITRSRRQTCLRHGAHARRCATPPARCR